MGSSGEKARDQEPCSDLWGIPAQPQLTHTFIHIGIPVWQLVLAVKFDVKYLDVSFVSLLYQSSTPNSQSFRKEIKLKLPHKQSWLLNFCSICVKGNQSGRQKTDTTLKASLTSDILLFFIFVELKVFFFFKLKLDKHLSLMTVSYLGGNSSSSFVIKPELNGVKEHTYAKYYP